MVVTLRDVTKDNWEDVIRLELPDEQRSFVASNVYSLAESKFYPGEIPCAIYAGDELVGFAMYCLDEDDGNYWIWRLMVDKRFQGKGYGRAAMNVIIERLRSDPAVPFVLISWDPPNTVAEKLYLSLGFEKTGDIIEGEVVARLDF